MPDLSESLQGRDLGHLRIVAELWGIPLEALPQRRVLARLCEAMLEPHLVDEIVGRIPGEAQLALKDLSRRNGRMPWSQFARRFGKIREMGPGRRDRELPNLNPVSTAEILWYRALVARAFFDAEDGPQEFAYIPHDLLPLLPTPDADVTAPPGHLASSADFQSSALANDNILDHANTLLAGLRLGISPESITEIAQAWSSSYPLSPVPLSPAALQSLLVAAGLIDANSVPQPDRTREFLEASRGEALARLARAWLGSPAFNELLLIPHLKAEGLWQNDPLRARQAVLRFIERVPNGAWWHIPSFLAAIRQEEPDFQRPAGDYDSWFIRDVRTAQFLRGFDHWEEVDGAVVHFLITGPLHWLGFVDLGSSTPSSQAIAFRFSRWASALFEGRLPQGLAVEEDTISAGSDALLRVTRLAPRTARYQLARFSSWEGEADGVYRYRLTPGSLARARQQGLTVAHLLAILRKYAAAVPPSLIKALERWEDHGAEVHLERALVLRLASPDILQALRRSRAARFLGDPLGTAAVIVKPGAWPKVLAVLVELGYLGEADLVE